MSEIDALEQRIAAALKRIGTAVDGVEAPKESADPQELAELRQALEDEKLVTAQFEERLKRLKTKYEVKAEELDKALEAQRMATARLDMELQRMRAANEQLRSSNAALRDANAGGVGEPHLINKAMLAELEGLRAAQAVSRAESAAVAETIELALAEKPDFEEDA